MFVSRECSTHPGEYDWECWECREIAEWLIARLKATQIKVEAPRPVPRALSMQLTVHADELSSGIAVSVISTHHTSRAAIGRSELVSLRHISRAEWDTDPIGCLADELVLLVAPSIGVS